MQWTECEQNSLYFSVWDDRTELYASKAGVKKGFQLNVQAPGCPQGVKVSKRMNHTSLCWEGPFQEGNALTSTSPHRRERRGCYKTWPVKGWWMRKCSLSRCWWDEDGTRSWCERCSSPASGATEATASDIEMTMWHMSPWTTGVHFEEWGMVGIAGQSAGQKLGWLLGYSGLLADSFRFHVHAAGKVEWGAYVFCSPREQNTLSRSLEAPL